MRVAIYARVSTENQETRGTIGSQLATLRTRVAAAQDDLVAEFCDDGYSGARLDRPGLDALRDAAEARLSDAVWCLSPDRLARMYAYQVIVLDELKRHGVRVLFCDAPTLDDLSSGRAEVPRDPELLYFLGASALARLAAGRAEDGIVAAKAVALLGSVSREVAVWCVDSALALGPLAEGLH